MATEMPIDPEKDRFIEGVQMNEDGGAEVELPNETPGIEEMPDGSAVVTMEDDFKGPTENEDFYENLAETMDMRDMDDIGLRYLDLLEKDKEARKERDKQYEDGLRRTGLGNDAPGGADFEGASKVVHPVMAEACVDFAARAVKELFPPDGPVRTNILGDVNDEKSEIAERKRDYMNWQLTDQIEEFRDEQEQMLTQLPMGGSQFIKMYWDDKLKRPCSQFIPIDNILMPFSAINFYTAQRITEVEDISEWEFKRRVDRGLYRDIDLYRTSLEPEPTGPEKANQKIEGKQYQDNEDNTRRVFTVYTWLELEDDPLTKGESAPYILMIDELDREVVGLYRNWEDGDETQTKLDWIVEFKFIPWRGGYGIGLPHLIGGLSAALTGSLRALMDSAHINNAATMLKLKGGKISGQSQRVDITQVVEIEGAPGVDDIRKIAMPMPFNPPSAVLFQLLGWLTTAAKGVVTTSEEKIADVNANAPVGTTQALIEQGAVVFSAIHARLHNSQKKVLMILQRLNRWYLEDMKRGDIVAELPIKSSDFRRNTDVLPVSDPHIFSETQRMAQTQAVMAYMKAYPALFDPRAVLARSLKQMKVPNIQELMPQYQKPMEMHAADENAAMAMGRMATAYPDQDHLAHLKAHCLFGTDQMLGANPIVAPAFIPRALEHIKQHMMLWYTQQMNRHTTIPAGVEKVKYEDSKVKHEIDKTMAIASDHLKLDAQEQFQALMPEIAKMLQIAQQFKPPAPPMDGDAQAILQASMAETQRRTAKDQQDGQIKQAEMQQKMAAQQQEQQFKAAMNAENNLTKERIDTLDLTLEAARLKKEQGESAIALQDTIQRTLGS
jgi:chaperonin GroES